MSRDASSPRFERFDEVPEQYDPDELEPTVFDFWDATDAYEKTKQHRAGEESFFFVDGPPYTSGAAHLGTAWNKSLKDAYIRYHRQQGYDVTDRPGYDMHGLPIETKVEAQLGFENKQDIEAFGMESFIRECREYAETQLQGLEEDFRSFGVWMDWERPYKTVSPSYMEAAWWGFKQAFERDLVTQGKRSITQCPRCETAIAKNEVEYSTAQAPSVYVRFDLTDRDGSLLIWTTTPWTIPANTFIAIDETTSYAGVRVETTDPGSGLEPGALIYLASDVVPELMERAGVTEYTVETELEGTELLGWSYDHPLAGAVPEHPSEDGAGEVYHADYVDIDRTGMVHSAPGHGEEDFARGAELGLEVFCPVGADGHYEEAGGRYAGEFVKDANEAIVADLDANGALALAEADHQIDEGQCWRCDTEIVRIVTDQWFISVSEIKDELLANIDDTEWHPQSARDNRFRKFVENSPDWNVSRQRYWGTPLPIWTPDGWDGDMEEVLVFGTRAALAEAADQDVDPETMDLHRPTVDGLTITRDGSTYRRVADVFDVWIDSSVASWATVDYPGEQESFDRRWPADLIMEAHDQTRGWFWSQLGMGSAAFERAPYEQVLMHGWALAADGRKMSKSLGNIVSPAEAIERHGADPMRLFLLGQNPQGDDMRFSWDEIETMQRELNILWNVFRFPLPYMRIDGFDPERDTLEAGGLETVDRWILSRLQTVKQQMTDRWEAFRQDRALETLLSFVVEDVSRYYIQVVRERMWEEERSASKLAAYATFYRLLTEIASLLAPFAPFVAERIYGTLTGAMGEETVHMTDWPSPDPAYSDRSLETDVELLRGVEEAGANARQQANRKLRWPVSRVVVAVDDEDAAGAIDRHRSLLADRLNAREIELIEPERSWGELAYSARADMSVLGPTFGGQAHEVMEALNDVRVDRQSLELLEEAVGDQLGRAVELSPEMVEFVTQTPADIEGTTVRVDGDERGVVYVDTGLTEAIEAEGYAREVIRRTQEMRKELDLELEAEINLELAVADERIADLVDRHRELIATEVRARAFDPGEEVDLRRTWQIEGIEVVIGVERCAAEPA